MQVAETRYVIDRCRLELALQMIAFEARTHTIRDCTGLSDDRIRKLYATYFKTRHGSLVRRQRGKSPRRTDVFFRNAAVQLEATTMALVLVNYGLVTPTQAVSEPRTDVEYGRQFCRAYAMFRVLCPDSKLLCFERAWSLCDALNKGDEVELTNCRCCDGVFVYDALSLADRICPSCKIKKVG